MAPRQSASGASPRGLTASPDDPPRHTSTQGGPFMPGFLSALVRIIPDPRPLGERRYQCTAYPDSVGALSGPPQF